MARTLSLWIVTAALASCGEPTAAQVADAVDAEYDADMAAPWTTLFDGVMTPEWRMSTISNQANDDPGSYSVVNGALVPRLGTDLGLLWHTTPAPADFELALEFRQQYVSSNSGVFVRFPDLDGKGYNNTAFVAVDFGYEVQIDGVGAPDGANHHKTGAIYNEPVQDFSLIAASEAPEWNEYRITVVGPVYTVQLNGAQTTRFVSSSTTKGVESPAYIGLQIHPGDGQVEFRNVRIRTL